MTIWRRRVEVESTIRPAKGRIAGFEGREGHRTPFASVICKVFRVQGLHPVRKFTHRRFGLWCYWGAIGNQRNGIVKVRNSEVCVPFRHGEAALRTVDQQFRDRGQIYTF
jgi:hypothetical protein